MPPSATTRPVVAVERSSIWSIGLADGRTVRAANLIIATGGRAAHQLGSTGDGLSWARKLGHSLTTTYAALVPIETVETWPGEMQGIKLDARVRAIVDSRQVAEGAGDLLFTSYGVSGPAVMAVAGAVAPLVRDAQVFLHIDLFPDMSADELDRTLTQLIEGGGAMPVRESLVGLLPKGMIDVILRLAGIDAPRQSNTIPTPAALGVSRVLKDLTLTVSKLRPFKEAQVTSGGVKTEEIDAGSCQSRIVESLHFAGEVMDVDGDSGGFNLQWAWSSGYVAGMHCGEPIL